MNGVVTVVFTDLVGSTALLGQLGEERADEVRRDHFAVLRAAVAAHGGEEVKNIGDSLMVAFTSPAAALACAVQMQQRVHAAGRAGGPPLGLRVGLNAGEATAEDGDYFGTAVVVAKRLCDAAAGGQILVSDVVRALVGSRGGFAFKNLGAIPLKGIDDPVPACEVAWEPGDEPVPLPGPIAADRTLLVEREHERQLLRGALRVAAGSRPPLVLIAGEPGVGKTSLAFEVAREAHDGGATVLYGRCEEELAIPYQPFAEAVGHLARHRSDAVAGVDLSRLVLGAPGSTAVTTADPEAERYRLFEAVRAAFDAAGAGAPVLLVLDDLHWADKPTLVLLRHLVRAPGTSPLLVVGTYRDVEVDRAHPLAQALPDLRREPGYERVLLRGLSGAGVAAYLEQRAGHALDETGRELATALHRETEGNPFFIREILRHLVESGAIYEREERWTSDRPIETVGLPESVREVIGRRLSRLGDECGRVLSVASVIGRSFHLRVLSRVADVDEDRLADLLDEAVAARGVIDEVPDAVDSYSFAHALVRETLYEELSTSRRVRLHRRVGEAIEALHAADLDPHLAELAHHFHEASVTGVEERAVDYARRAAARAVEQLAFEEAATHVERALQTLDAIDEPDPEVVCETLVVAAEVHQWMASVHEARRYGARAAEIARHNGWPERLGRAALAHGGLWVDIGLADEKLVGLLREAIAALPDDHPMVPLLEGRLAMDFFTREPADLEAHSVRAVELARSQSDRRTLAYALVARRHAVSGPARLDERLALSSEAIRLAREVGDANLEMRARAFRIVELAEAADVDATCADEAEFVRLAVEYRQPFYLHYMRQFVGVGIAIREGRFDEAAAALGPLTELARHQGRLTAIVATSSQRLLLDTMRGELPPGDAVDVTLAFARTVPWGAPTVAWVQLNVGRIDEAREAWARDGQASIGVIGDHWATLMTLQQAAEVAAAFHDRDAAAAVHERLREYSGRLVVLAGTALVAVSAAVDDGLGLCTEVLDRPGEAVAHYDAALALHERWGMRPFRVVTRIRLARALAARGAPGDRERAIGTLDAALAEADAIGFGMPLLAEARALRSSLRASAPPG